MHRSLGNDVGVESVAEVDGVDVVTREATRLALQLGVVGCRARREGVRTIPDRCT